MMKVSTDIENLVAYAPGKPLEEIQRELGLERICKLASNENPIGVSPLAVAAMTRELENLHRYPDPSSFELCDFLSRQWNLPMDHILIGNGSNELIDLLIRVFCQPGDNIVMPEKSFIAYGICAQAARVGRKELPLIGGSRPDVAAIIDFIENDKTEEDKILFLANPNNPTGAYINDGEMRELMKVCGRRDDLLVVVDEAYNEFVRALDYPDAVDLVKEHKNFLVLRTFSKVYGLAGLRVGALLGAPEALKYVHRVRMPFNVNRLVQKAVIASMQDTDFIKKSQQTVWEGLDYFYRVLNEMGLSFIPSQGNFVLVDTHRDAKAVFKFCLERGVVFRAVTEYGLPTHLRISVGMPEENTLAMRVLLESLQAVLP